jgi:hypothetical protein
MQDIVPKGRSIRNVPVSAQRAVKVSLKKETVAEKTLKKDIATKIEAEKNLEEDIEIEQEQVEMMEQERLQKEALRSAKAEFEENRSRRPRRNLMNFNKKSLYIAGGVLGVIALAIIITSIFHSALVTVMPHTATSALNGDFVAKKTPAANELGYQAITVDQTGSETVKATGQKQVSTRASGTITIFNNYSSAVQRLIKNTRFATPEGLIFRISDSVTVPGKKGTIPGSIDATVVADEAGTTYNVGLKDFTIPGFKGDPRYSTFYARSKTPLAGGFVGVQKIVSDADRAKAKADIESKIHDDLIKQITAKRSADTIIYDSAYTVEYKMLPDEVIAADQVSIKEQGTLSAAAFDKKALSSALARTLIPGYKGDVVTIPLASAFVFTPKDFKPATADSISFHLSGTAAFEWVYDEVALKNALKGQPRSNTQAVIGKFPMIEKADISIRPFWSRSFPSSVDKITIKKAL